MYDVTNQQSFNDLKFWIRECEINGLVEIPRILIGNKCDMPAVVDRMVAQKFADENGMLVRVFNCVYNSNINSLKKFPVVITRLKYFLQKIL